MTGGGIWGESDPESDGSTDDHILSEKAKKIIDTTKDQAIDLESSLERLRRKDRNIEVDIVVVDRRGRGVPTLLCRSDNVVVSCHTGTGEMDFVVVKRLPWLRITL